MWFRQLQLYQLTDDFTLTAEQLDELLQSHQFKPCAGLDTHRSGWSTPLGQHSELLVHTAQGRHMLCLRREDRILPAAVIREAVDEKVAQIEANEARPVGRKEKSRLKDEVTVDLLPRAFAKSSYLYGYIDPRTKFIVINAGSANKAEQFLSKLREAIGSLKVIPLAVNQAPADVFTQWCQTHATGQFNLGDEIELKEMLENGAVVKAKKVTIQDEEIQSHLNTGMRVTKLGIEWNDRITAMLADDLSIKRLRFTDLVMEESADIESDDYAARFDADFVLMANELKPFFEDLIVQFGGTAD